MLILHLMTGIVFNYAAVHVPEGCSLFGSVDVVIINRVCLPINRLIYLSVIVFSWQQF